MSTPTRPRTMPSDVAGDRGPFDRFAGAASSAASSAPFFAACLILVALWLFQGAVVMIVEHNLSSFLSDRYQLEINTTTTIITFLLVALLQNASTRSDLAVQHKLNAIADGLADLMEHLAADDAGGVATRKDLTRDLNELRQAVGLELRESTGHHASQRRTTT